MALIALALAEAHHRLTIILQISNESLAARLFRVAQLSKQATPGQALQVRLWVFLVGFEAEGTTDRQFGFALVERCQRFSRAKRFAADYASVAFIFTTDCIFDAHLNRLSRVKRRSAQSSGRQTGWVRVARIQGRPATGRLPESDSDGLRSAGRRWRSRGRRRV